MSTLSDDDILLVERGGVQYKVEHQNLSELNPTDLLLVERGGVQYKVEFQNESNILNDDLFLVERSGTSYKVEKQDLTFTSGPLGWNEMTSSYPSHPSSPHTHIYYWNGYLYTDGGYGSSGDTHGSATQTDNKTLDNISSSYISNINGSYVYKTCNNLSGANMRRDPKFFVLGNRIHAAVNTYCNTPGSIYSTTYAQSGNWSYDGQGPYLRADHAASNGSYAILLNNDGDVFRYTGTSTTTLTTDSDNQQWYMTYSHSGGTSTYGEYWKANGVAYGNGKWVIAYKNSIAPGATPGGNVNLALAVSTSSSPSDGANYWTSPSLNSSMYNGGFIDVAFGNNTFVALSNSSAKVAVSTNNGSTWSSHNLPSGFSGSQKISFAGEYFIVGVANKTAVSKDGQTWTVVKNDNGGDGTVGGTEMEVVYDPISDFYFGVYMSDSTWSGNFGSYPYNKQRGQIIHYAKRFE